MRHTIVSDTDSRGGPDNNSDHEAAFAQVRQIAAAVDVPVTADLEGGYGLSPDQLVDAMLDAGAVGCNIEDTDHRTGEGLLDAGTHAEYLAGIRAAATRRGVGIVLNARIDAIIRHPDRDAAAALGQVLRRPAVLRRRCRLRLPGQPARAGAGRRGRAADRSPSERQPVGPAVGIGRCRRRADLAWWRRSQLGDAPTETT
jgi:Phosphoenolpyruvate phosphomutase